MNRANMKTVACEASFKKNAEYDFTFEGFSVWNGERYMLLSFGDEHAVTVRGCEAAEYVFRTKLLPFQAEFNAEDVPSVIRCRVKGFLIDESGDETGMPILYQCREPIMMRYYQVGKTYSFKIYECPGTVLDGGKVTDWYTLVDFMNFRYRYWSFEMLHVGESVYATVDRFEDGRMRFRDHDEYLLTGFYKVGDVCDFEIVGDEASNKPESRYFALRDTRKDSPKIEHRFYYPEAFPVPKKIGDTIRLRVGGFVKGRWLRLNYEGECVSDEDLKKLSLFDANGISDPTVETECISSFAFTHGSVSPDIDNRLGHEIMLRINALANTDGGRILVGISSEMSCRGIAQDLPYLNASSEDAVAYPQTLDGLRQKILDVVAAKLGKNALSLVTVSFHKVEQEKVVCEIAVAKSMWPVYFCQRRLYVKNGIERQQLLGDDITQFVLSRLAAFAVTDRGVS